MLELGYVGNLYYVTMEWGRGRMREGKRQKVHPIMVKRAGGSLLMAE